MGWEAISAVTWSSPIIAILIFAILITNIVMLILKATDTLDVDIWNYHHLAIVGIMVFEVTHNIVYAILASIVMAIITFKLSDWTALGYDLVVFTLRIFLTDIGYFYCSINFHSPKKKCAAVFTTT